MLGEAHVSGLYFGQEDEGELRGQCVLLHGLPFLPVPLEGRGRELQMGG